MTSRNASSVRLAEALAAWQKAVNRAHAMHQPNLPSKFPFTEHSSAKTILNCATALNALLDSLAAQAKAKP